MFHRYNMTKDIIRLVHVALGRSIMKEFAKQFMAPQILFMMKSVKKKWHRRVLHELIQSLTSMPLRSESVSRSRVGTISLHDVTIARGRIM